MCEILFLHKSLFPNQLEIISHVVVKQEVEAIHGSSESCETCRQTTDMLNLKISEALSETTKTGSLFRNHFQKHY